MIDIRRLHFNGKLNYQNGLLFYFARQGQVISFLIDTIGDRKKRIRVTMQPDINHERPHIHIGQHDASFAIDTGELLAGDCDNKTKGIVQDWIHKHKQDLQQLWEIAKDGRRYESLVEKVRKDKGFREYGFTGEEPAFANTIRGVKVWHNGDLILDENDDVIKVVCDGDLFVGVPVDYDDAKMTFESLNGDVKIKKG